MRLLVRHRVSACLLVALSGAVPAANAQQPAGQGRQDVTFGLSVGATHSDNVLRTSADEQSDTSVNAGVQIGFTRRTDRLESEISVDTEYRRYSSDTYPNELVGGLDAALTYWFSPQRFGWVVDNSFGQSFIDARLVETPENRQNVNLFSTGPDLLVQLGDRTDLSLSGRYSTATYEESETDDERYSGTVALIRRLGTRSALSLKGAYEQVEFKDDLAFGGYERTSLSLGFSAQGARTTLRAEGGYTRLSGIAGESGGPLVNLSVVRELTARTSLTLNAGTSFTDSAEAFRRDRRLGGVLLENDLNPVSADPFQSDFASLAWALRAERTSITLTGDWRSDDRASAGELNRDSIGGRLAVARRLSPVLQLALDGGWRSEDFDGSDVSFDETTAGVALEWSVSRTFRLTLRGDHARGSGDSSGLFGSRDYTENRYTVSVSYAPRS